jgi:hypothetical protein
VPHCQELLVKKIMQTSTEKNSDNFSLMNKHILLGVSGSIAAYKAAELVRRLKEGGADVRVVLSQGGAEFVTIDDLEWATDMFRHVLRSSRRGTE